MITVLRKKIRVFCQYEFPYCNDMITDAAHPAAFSFLPAWVRATNTGKVRLLYFVVFVYDFVDFTKNGIFSRLNCDKIKA